LEAYREALSLTKSPYILQLEDDVLVKRRVLSGFNFHLNGWLLHARLTGEAESFVRKKIHNEDHQFPLSGYGGSILETKYWRETLSNPNILPFTSDFFEAVVNKEFGTDYLLSAILYAFNGTMGNYEGFMSCQHNEFIMRLALDQVTVIPDFKYLYGRDDELTEEELEILGPNWLT